MDLTAHLQQAVLDAVIEEQMDAFHERLESTLEYHVRQITLGQIDHIRDVLTLRDQLDVRLEVTMKEASA